MRKYLLVLIFISLYAEDNRSIESSENNSSKVQKNVYVIDLDKEVNNSTRGKNSDNIIYGSIYIDNENDEVSLRGKILLEKAPVTVSYGKNDEVKVVGNSITINTMELKNNSHIIMKDKNGIIFVDQILRK